MTKVNSSSHSPRKFLLWTGLAGGLILTALIIISLTLTVKEKQKVDKIPVDATSPVQLVSGFPEFPVYPGAQLISSEKRGQGEEIKYKGVWEVDHSVPQVMKWYADNLGSFGWKTEVYPADLKANRVQFLVARKQDLNLNLSVIRQDGAAVTEIVAEFIPPAKEDEE